MKITENEKDKTKTVVNVVQILKTETAKRLGQGIPRRILVQDESQYNSNRKVVSVVSVKALYKKVKVVSCLGDMEE